VHWFVEFQPKGADSWNSTSPAVWQDLVLLVAGPGPGSLCLRVKPDGGYEEVWKERRAALDSQFNTVIPLEGFAYGFTSKWNRQAQFRCIDLRTGQMQWEFPSQIGRGSALAVAGRIMLWGEEGHLACLDADPRELHVRSLTPEPLLGAPCFSAPVLHRGLLYLRNEGTLVCLSLRK
jgi:outer membrane protein assembly factor BamB